MDTNEIRQVLMNPGKDDLEWLYEQIYDALDEIDRLRGLWEIKRHLSKKIEDSAFKHGI